MIWQMRRRSHNFYFFVPTNKRKKAKALERATLVSQNLYIRTVRKLAPVVCFAELVQTGLRVIWLFGHRNKYSISGQTSQEVIEIDQS